MDRSAFAAVVAGGLAGGSLRWAVVEGLPEPTSFPLAVFALNVVGSMLLGFVVAREWRSPSWRLAVGVGFCGSLTTFSGFAVDVAEFLRSDRYGLAVGYAAASIAAGLGGARVGALER